MAQAIDERDTLATSVVNTTGPRMMVGMTLTLAPESDWGHEEPQTLAEVHRFPHPLDPTPEEVAAKKARRRLDAMEQGRDRNGVTRAHYYNTAGFDVWGYDSRGQYDPAQDTHTAIPNPFAH